MFCLYSRWPFASQVSAKKRKLKENGVVPTKPNTTTVNKKKPKKLVKSVSKGEQLETVTEVTTLFLSLYYTIFDSFKSLIV